MKYRLGFILLCFNITGCATLSDWFARSEEPKQEVQQVATVAPEVKRTTRRSLEEQSLLGESTGSLWMGRGQQAFLFTNNNQRLLGDVLNVKIEGYPKEQIQTKINTISKLLAEILGEQKQEIEFKQQELKKKLPTEDGTTPQGPKTNDPVFLRGLASSEEDEEGEVNVAEIQKELKQNEKQLKNIGDESDEIAQLKSAKDLPIKSIPTRIVDLQKDGNYRVRGEQPFMIGKREYKLLVMGTVKSEEYKEEGISAESLVDPVFDIISEKRTEAL